MLVCLRMARKSYKQENGLGRRDLVLKTQVRNTLPRGKVVRNSTMLQRKTKQKRPGNKDRNRKQLGIQLEIARKKSESLQKSDKNREEPKKTAG